jgi:hypothetical protein
LSSDRSFGMSEGPIPFSAIDRYARRYGIDALDEFEAFLAIMQGVDQAYLGFRAEAAERNRSLNEQLRKQDKPPKQIPRVLQEDD